MQRRKHVCVALLSLLLAIAFANACLTPKQLKNAVDTILSDNAAQLAHTTPGIYIQQLNKTSRSWNDLYALRHNEFHAPASNNKVLTTAAITAAMSPDTRMMTPFYLIDTAGPALMLCVRGVGDPSMTPQKLTDAIKDLTQFLSSAGIQSVRLDDDTYLPKFPEGWPWGDLPYYYGAQPNGLILEENVVSFVVSPGASEGAPLRVTYKNKVDEIMASVDTSDTTTSAHGKAADVDVTWKLGSESIFVVGSLPLGSSPVSLQAATVTPAKRWGKDIIRAIKEVGITIANENLEFKPCGVPDSVQPVYMMKSDRLGDMVNHTMQVSDNLMAEMWSRYLGLTMPIANPSHSATTRGIESVASILTQKLGVPVGSFRQRDGSGLDSANLLTPVALLATLKGMAEKTPYGDIYRSYLPSSVPGGMLYSRFQGTPAVGRVFAKTGYISLTSSLSGWVDTDKLFSIILDQSNTDSSVRKKIIDKIVVAIADLCPAH